MSDMKSLMADGNHGVVVFRAGSTVKGIVLDVTASRILIDLEGGMTGIVPKKETSGYGVATQEFEVGEPIEAVVIDPENEQGLVMLSLRRASQDMVWAELHDFQTEERIIKIKIEDANKGGLMAKYKGLKMFLPVSQLMPVHYPRVEGGDGGAILARLQSHIGSEFTIRIITADREEDKVIISERAAYVDQMKETLRGIKVGERIKGKVSGIVKFGIFVSYNGIEGLVHLSELDWGLVSNPSNRYKLGEEVEVLVIGAENEKLSFSIKQLSENPWLKKIEGMNVGDKVEGKVIRWNRYGVTIQIKEGVTGNFDLSQFGVSSSDELSVSVGDQYSGVIDQINGNAQKLILKKTDA